MTAADVTFCDVFVRACADKRAQDYYWAKTTVNEWNARGGASAIPNTAAIVPDSASNSPLSGVGNDGRPVITGAMVNSVITRAQDIVTDFEATNNAKLNTILQVAVNPTQNTQL